jgi:hypothetical protein
VSFEVDAAEGFEDAVVVEEVEVESEVAEEDLCTEKSYAGGR